MSVQDGLFFAGPMEYRVRKRAVGHRGLAAIEESQMTGEEREKEISLPDLESKREAAEMVVEEALNQFGNKVAVCWTGGKDSTVVLWLVRRVCKRFGRPLPRCLFIDEGDVFDEIRSFVSSLQRKWDLPLEVLCNRDLVGDGRKIGERVRVVDLDEVNREELRKIGFKDDSFPFEPESFVGNHLCKTLPLKRAVEELRLEALFVALRRDEHPARESEEVFSHRDDPRHVRIHPILDFRERDIWDLIHAEKIPYCELYEKGYRSLGARYNTFPVSDVPAWAQDLELLPERSGRGQGKEKIMEQLRSLGYM